MKDEEFVECDPLPPVAIKALVRILDALDHSKIDKSKVKRIKELP